MKVTIPARRLRRAASDAVASDGALIEAARRGSAEAFGILVERHRTFAFACAYGLVKSSSHSEEIAQEAFLTAWRRLPVLRPPYHFRGWLFGIVRNISLHWQRDERSRGFPDIQSPGPSPLDCVITREEEHALGRALGRVPEIYRLALVLHHGDQMSIPEVAQALGISESNVRQRLVRGRQLLQQKVAFVEAALAKIKPRKGLSAAILAAIALDGRGAGAAGDVRAEVQVQGDVQPPTRAMGPGGGVVVSATFWFFVYLTLAGGVEGPAGTPPAPAASQRLDASLAPAFAPVAGDRARAGGATALPAVTYDFDFEDGVLPALFHQGHVVAGPPGSPSRHCVTGTLDPAWSRSYQIRILSLGSPLFYHSDTAVLSFDYWVGADYRRPAVEGGRPTAISVSVGNMSQGQNYSAYIHDYVTDAWGHVEVPLSAFTGNLERARRQEPGDRIREIGIYAGRVVGQPLFIDNIKLTSGSQ